MDLDDYERDARKEIEAWYHRQAQTSDNPLTMLNRALNSGVGKALSLPGVRDAVAALDPVLRGGFATAAKTIPLQNVVAEYAEQGAGDLSEIRGISLRYPDQATRNFGPWYMAGASAEGAATGGAALIPVVGNIAAVALIGADLVAVTGLGMRLVCDHAAHYGYDPNDPREQIFMQGIFGLVGVAAGVEKTKLLQELRVVASEIARRATWAQLRKHVAVNAIEASLGKVGVTLVKRQLAVAVPIIGAGAGAAANAWFMSTLDDQARYAYRRRFLDDKESGPGCPQHHRW